MNKIKLIKKKLDEFDFPFMGYIGYTITKFFDNFRTLSFLLDKMETITMRKDMAKLRVDRPIYITGLARAGTTIVLEMLSKHPDLATHRYKHMLMPYLPHWLSQVAKRTNVYTKPFERPHKDGIFVTRESPEAVEEMLWQKFFNKVYDENTSNIFDINISNLKFERFYKNHILKLILNQKRSRYLAKNNYNVTRMEYLLQIFPSSKFLLIIRNPVNHIASLIKQTGLFIEIERKKPLFNEWLRMIGHREFGHNSICINVGNKELIHKIRKLWKNEETYVKGWAYYWYSIYDYVAEKLETNKKLKKATLIVKYEELCKTPAKIIDNILQHTELSTKKFKKVKNYYIEHLHEPTYYIPDFSKQELDNIAEITSLTTKWFGYV
ncbi:MAG: sulfotransferase [Promethearchaeota archaeon]